MERAGRTEHRQVRLNCLKGTVVKKKLIQGTWDLKAVMLEDGEGLRLETASDIDKIEIGSTYFFQVYKKSFKLYQNVIVDFIKL